MAYEIVVKQRFINRLNVVYTYLEKEWGKKVADDFLTNVELKIQALSQYPYLGAPSNLKNIRSYHITKHNRLQCRVLKTTIVIIDLDDTRQKNYKLWNPPK